MTDQVFELDNYRGPLDLLLHLVREQEMEITEVNLAKLCDQYLVALEAPAPSSTSTSWTLAHAGTAGSTSVRMPVARRGSRTDEVLA
ncbi:MAG: hypothetical protein HC807_05115 [Gammaproteobacteria bacterium]|nr:hypothetical protein [Gammaproteobacteria bacterium]